MKKNIIEIMTKINEQKYLDNNLNLLKELTDEYPDINKIIEFKENLIKQGYKCSNPEEWLNVPKSLKDEFNHLVYKYFSLIFQEYLEIQAIGENK